MGGRPPTANPGGGRTTLEVPRGGPGRPSNGGAATLKTDRGGRITPWVGWPATHKLSILILFYFF